jgi:hypothetical protein
LIIMFGKKLIASAGIATALLWASAANATTISIGFKEDGGGITTVATGTTPIVVYTGGFGPGGAVPLGTGDFDFNIATGNQNGTQSFFTQLNLAKTTAGAHVLDVYLTLSDIDNPHTALLGESKFKSIFDGGISKITEQTFVDPGNQLWGTSGTSILLAQSVFNNGAFTNDSSSGTVDPGIGPFFSVTARYTIETSGAGTANPTIDIIGTTPLPGTLPLIASGLGALWMVGRKRKARKAPAVA